MTGITIFMEGGGSSTATRVALRQGMDAFLQPLKQAARDKGWSWNLVCRGPRGEAFRALSDAVSGSNDTVFVLLVDAEGPVASSARRHLEDRDGWDLSAVPEDHVHLMVQTMEAWLAADPATLSRYFGNGFILQAIAQLEDLESIRKQQLDARLRRATRPSSKRDYHKTKHASELLSLIDRNTVAARCMHCKRLFEVLGNMIAAA